MSLSESSEDLADAEKRKAFFLTQKAAMKSVKQISRTLLKGAPNSPLGDFTRIVKWTAWADDSIEAALRGKAVKPPPGSLCSGFSVPSQAVVDYMASIADSHYVIDNVPDYNAFIEFDPRTKRQTYRQLTIDVMSEFERDEDYRSSRELLDHLGKEVRGYKLYYQRLNEILSEMVEFPVYFISRQAVVCWFSLETSIIPALDALDAKVNAAKTEIDNLEQERASSLREWATEHLFAVEIEEFELDAYLLEIEAGKVEFEQLKETIKELVADSKDLEKAKELSEVNLRAAELDKRNLKDQSFNFNSGKTNLQNRLRRAQSFDSQTYNRCPNGNAYADCSHDIIKANWNRQKQDNRNLITQLRNDLTILNRRMAQGEADISALDQAIRAHKLEASQIQSELDHISQEVSEITQELVENVDLGGLSEDEIIGFINESRGEASQIKALLAQ